MTERDLWNRHLRPILHKPEAGRLAYKVQDAFVKGLPDIFGIASGTSYWLELKVLKHAPVRDGTPWRLGVTTEQNRWLDRFQRAGGRGFVLMVAARERRWYLFTPPVPAEWDGIEPIVWADGELPFQPNALLEEIVG